MTDLMSVDANHSVADFLSATAAKQPAPGGGSVAAIAGALSAALGEMVLNYSIGKKDLAEHEPVLQAALHDLGRARQLLIGLMVEDQEAFAAHAKAKKLTASEDRQQLLQETLANCIRVPQTVGATAAIILRQCQQLVEQVNRFLLSDLAICAELAMAAVRCAAYNVYANLPEIVDAAERDRLATTTKSEIAEAIKHIRDIDARIWLRVGRK